MSNICDPDCYVVFTPDRKKIFTWIIYMTFYNITNSMQNVFRSIFLSVDVYWEVWIWFICYHFIWLSWKIWSPKIIVMVDQHWDPSLTWHCRLQIWQLQCKAELGEDKWQQPKDHLKVGDRESWGAGGRGKASNCRESSRAKTHTHQAPCLVVRHSIQVMVDEG